MARIDSGPQLSGRDLVAVTARRAREQGWVVPESFNIAQHERETIELLFAFLGDAVHSQVEAQTRGGRRTARRVAWWLRGALLDLKVPRARVDAVMLLSGADVVTRAAADWQPLAVLIAWRRAEVALGQERRRTLKRVVRDILALNRLERALVEREVVTPVGRASLAYATEARTPASVVRPELNNPLSSLQERLGRREEEERSEAEPGACSPRTTRPGERATGGLAGDGAEDDGWGGIGE